ncbi:hypothetical protein BDN72DRAFT_389899 [Pluteus cervinus]|uniref:Uncharacterized protein n=1 Tax=Pluteus cervinus TaxID=181527 RepID=A0ACD3B346_9AGAR|nr:hypothetical protein BDN72DRAFT_389899 [Pluteus cervinus]
MDGNSQQDTYFVTLKDFLENQARLEAEQRDLDQKKILNEVGRRNFDGLIKDLLYREAHGEDISQELRSLQAVPNTRIGPLQVSLPSLPPRTIQAPPASTQGNRPNVSYASTANWQPYQSGQSSSSSWPRQGNSGSSYTTHPPTNPYRAAAEQYNSGVIALVSPQVQQAQYQNSTHPSAQQQYVSTHGAQSSNTTTYYPPPVRAAAHYSSASALPGNTSSLAGALGEPTTLNAQPPVDPAQTAQSATPGSATINSSTNHAPSNTVSSPQQIYSEEAALRLSARYKEYIQGWAQNAPANSHFSVKGTTFTVYKDHGNRVWVVMPGKKSQVYAPIGRIDEIFSKYFQACRRGIYEDRNGTVATFNGTLSPEMRSKWHIYFDPIAFNIAGPDVIQIGRQAEGSTLFPSEGTATSSRGGTTPTGSRSTPVTAVTTAPPAAAIRGYPSSHTTTTSIAPSTAAVVVPVTPKSPPPAPVSLPKEPDGLHTAGSSATTAQGNIEKELTATLSHQPHTAFVPSAPGPSSHVESDLQSHDAPLQRPMQPPPTALDAIPDQSGFDLTAPPKEKTAIKQKLSGLVGPGKYLARDILIALGFTAQGQKRQLQDDDVQENPAKRRAIEAPVPQPLASSSTAYFTPSTSLPVVASVRSPSLPPVADIAPRSALPQSPVHSPEAAKIQHPIPTSIVATPVQPSPPPTASEAIPDEPQVTNDNIYIPDEEKVPSVRVTPPEREIIVIEDSPTPPASNHATPPPMTPPTLPTSSPSPNAAVKRPQVPLQARQKTPSTTSVSTGPDLSGRPSTPQSQARKSYSSSPEQVQTSAVKGKQKERKHPSTDRSSLDVDLYQSRSAASTSVSGGKVKDSHKSGFRKETSLDIARLRSPSLPPPPPAALGRTSTMERNIARSLSPLDLQYLPLPATRISAASTHQGQQHQQHVPLFLPSPSSSRSSLDMIRPSYHTDEHRESSVELMDMTEDGIEVRRYPIMNTAYVQVPPRPAYLKKHLAKKSEPSKSKSVARRRSISEGSFYC